MSSGDIRARWIHKLRVRVLGLVDFDEDKVIEADYKISSGSKYFDVLILHLGDNRAIQGARVLKRRGWVFVVQRSHKLQPLPWEPFFVIGVP